MDAAEGGRVKKAKTGGSMSEGAIMVALRERYPSREYALLDQVRNCTGFARRIRTADAVALSLWPSRGILLHGFEIKVSRTDWKREKDDPEKAEEIARFCDFWWLVVGSVSIVELGELPATWGLLAPDDAAARLVVVREATKLDAEPWSRAFMAAALRRAGESMTPTRAVAQMTTAAEQKGFERGKGSSPDSEAERELKTLRELQEKVRAFERASGLRIEHGWQRPEEIGEAVTSIIGAKRSHERFIEQLRARAAALPSAVRREFENLESQAKLLEQSLKLHVQQLELKPEIPEPKEEVAI